MVRCHSALVSSPSLITATAALSSAGGVEQAASWVRAGLGPRVDVEREGEDALVARCGSRGAYRLLGAWARPCQLPLRARFDFTARQGVTQVAVSMNSDQGWYLASTERVCSAYRARFEQMVVDLQRAGLELSGPIEHRQVAAGSVGR